MYAKRVIIFMKGQIIVVGSANAPLRPLVRIDVLLLYYLSNLVKKNTIFSCIRSKNHNSEGANAPFHLLVRMMYYCCNTCRIYSLKIL